MKPDGRNIEVEVKRIINEEGEEQKSAPHPKQVLYVDLDGKAEQYDIFEKSRERIKQRKFYVLLRFF